MLFQELSLLWWFLPVGGFILALYLLKIKRQDVRVPATFLWPRITTDVRANSLFQRLKPNLLLFLQLLIALLALLALSRPLWRTQSLLGSATVVVVDTSASMGATDVLPSRFEKVRFRLSSLIAAMAPNDRLAIIEAGAGTRVVASLTSDKKRLQEAVNGLHQSDSPNNIGEALRLATALVGIQKGSRIVLMSDGAFGNVRDFSPGKAQFVYENFGKLKDNVAITAMDTDEVPNGRQLFVALRNFSDKPAKGILNLSIDGSLIDARPIEIAPGQLHGETLMLPPKCKRIDAQFEGQDLLKSDNTATLLGAGSAQVRVLLVGPGNFFLERALALEPTVKLDKGPAIPDNERPGSSGVGYDLVVFDGAEPTPVKAPSVILISATDPEGPVSFKDDIKLPAVTDWVRDHPVMRYVGMDGVLIDHAKNVEAYTWGTVLVESRDTPLIVAGQNKGKKWLYIGWNLTESDFPLKSGFPIFVGNALRWLTGERPVDQGFAVKAGVPFSVPVAGRENSLTLDTPDHRSLPIEAQEGTVVIRGADVVGVYDLHGKSLRSPFAVNLLNQEESNIQPRMSLEFGGREVAAKGQGIALRELWRYLALLALVIMGVEWWVFIRRS
jgi:Ca-activated chloride channel family protein